MKKLICLLVFIFMLPISVMAQDNIPHGSILRGTYKEERINPGFKKPLISSGIFVISPDHGIIWEARDPFATKTIITQNGVAQEVNGQKTMFLGVQKVPFIQQIYKLIGSVLLGNWSMLDKDFIVKKSGDSHKWKVILLSRNSENINMPFNSIEVDGSHFADKVLLKKKDGGTHRLTFKDQVMSEIPLSKDEKASFDMVNH